MRVDEVRVTPPTYRHGTNAASRRIPGAPGRGEDHETCVRAPTLSVAIITAIVPGGFGSQAVELGSHLKYLNRMAPGLRGSIPGIRSEKPPKGTFKAKTNQPRQGLTAWTNRRLPVSISSPPTRLSGESFKMPAQDEGAPQLGDVSAALAFSSQKPMSISPYIVAAVVRCFPALAPSRAPR